MCSSASATNSITRRKTRRCIVIQDQVILIHRPQNQLVLDVTVLEEPPIAYGIAFENSYSRINVRYLNDEGRLLVLTHAVEIHHDFTHLSPIMSVTILRSSLSLLQSSLSIEYAGGDGAVFFL
jgi:hypothetical protein